MCLCVCVSMHEPPASNFFALPNMMAVCYASIVFAPVFIHSFLLHKTTLYYFFFSFFSSVYFLYFVTVTSHILLVIISHISFLMYIIIVIIDLIVFLSSFLTIYNVPMNFSLIPHFCVCVFLFFFLF